MHIVAYKLHESLFVLSNFIQTFKKGLMGWFKYQTKMLDLMDLSALNQIKHDS